MRNEGYWKQRHNSAPTEAPTLTRGPGLRLVCSREARSVRLILPLPAAGDVVPRTVFSDQCSLTLSGFAGSREVVGDDHGDIDVDPPSAEPVHAHAPSEVLRRADVDDLPVVVVNAINQERRLGRVMLGYAPTADRFDLTVDASDNLVYSGFCFL